MLPNSLLELISLLVRYTVPKINLDKFCDNLGRGVYIRCVCYHSWEVILESLVSKRVKKRLKCTLSGVVFAARGAR